ncbi:aspartate--tRNA ligase [Candidatus Hepatobacter penaei]|uniref:aspartate--tRNA ligase n=1 Tax=Candidatus Hepatobacter penaei TaxID=1274402 RepID=UPI0024815FBC|nr:aspartate--tRNA ligase [Candidatus Hepatobacter penaei]
MSHIQPSPSYRSHFCGALSEKEENQHVRVCGWVHNKRDHGGLLFVDVRDTEGLVQCVVQEDAPFFKVLDEVPYESVVQLEGRIVLRTPETVNTELSTGKIELSVDKAEVLSRADPLPMQVNGESEFPEDTRLKYRFLDLRRARMHANLKMRTAIIRRLRELMQAQGFLEVQTPILTSSSPEGARDFLVPSRLNPGHFYALPQAPQQFKQLLIASGVDRYFQIAPCFRDEDARRDRSPGEFYQLDLEMAFVTQEDVFATMEPVLSQVFQEFSQGAFVTPAPFPRITYDDAMLHYGTDKPDLRNPLRIQDATDCFKGTGFDVFLDAVAQGAVIRALHVPGVAAQSRKFFDEITQRMQEEGAKGLAYLLWRQGEMKGPLAKFFEGARGEALRQRMGTQERPIQEGDGLFFICDKPDKAAFLAGRLRTLIGEKLDLIEKNAFRFCWVVDFPMYEKDPHTGAIVFSHNPFSMPQGGMDALCNKDPLEIKAFQYDIVVNGIELSSGAIRNHLPEVMLKAFAIAGYDAHHVEEKFGALFRAFHYGVPPHGGFAPGIDRIVMLLTREASLREVIAFPLNQKAQDPLMGAPSTVPASRLKELGLVAKERRHG